MNKIISGQRKLDKLVKASDNAMSMITKTIEALEKVNVKIDTTRGDMLKTVENLNMTLDSLEKQHKTNTKMVGKFKSFIDD